MGFRRFACRRRCTHNYCTLRTDSCATTGIGAGPPQRGPTMRECQSGGNTSENRKNQHSSHVTLLAFLGSLHPMPPRSRLSRETSDTDNGDSFGSEKKSTALFLNFNAV